MSRYEAIVFDVDGTAVPNRPDGMPSRRLIDTIHRHRDRFRFVAATGRPLRTAMPIIQALGLTDLCIVSGGTIIVHPTTQEIVSHTALPRPALQSLLGFALKHPYTLTLRDDEIQDISTHTISEDIEIATFSGIPKSEVKAVYDFVNTLPDVIATTVPDWTSSGMAVIVTHRSATKQHAAAEVLRLLNVPAAAAIGIGDGNIDLHLFRSVGLKVAMGNASPDLLAAADLVAPTIADDGLADIIERYAAL